VVIKTQFIIHSETKIPEAVNNFYWFTFTVYRNGAVRGVKFTKGVQDEFFSLGDVEDEVTVLTLLCKVCNGLVIF